MYKTNEITPLLKKIFDEHGYSVLNNAQIFVSLIRDYLSEKGYKKEAAILAEIYSIVSIGKRLYENRQTSQTNQEKAAKQILNELRSNYDEETAEFAVMSVTGALNWQLSISAHEQENKKPFFGGLFGEKTKKQNSSNSNSSNTKSPANMPSKNNRTIELTFSCPPEMGGSTKQSNNTSWVHANCGNNATLLLDLDNWNIVCPACGKKSLCTSWEYDGTAYSMKVTGENATGNFQKIKHGFITYALADLLPNSLDEVANFVNAVK
ncbi:MAG: hypothetical protein FWG64_14060 [Firmicutes bacterium]|nr:hypothetical protein [Bacillota bacterium]